MNKFSLTLALGTGLALGATAPAARASSSGTQTAQVPTIQTLSAANMSATEFNALFKPDTAAQTSTIDFNGAPNSGVLASQVFTGGKDATSGVDATGLYAYAYQVAVNNVTNAQGEPTHIDGASWQFNATPTTLAGSPTNFAYTIKDGAVGGLSAPTSDGTTPNLSWQPGTTIGSIRANFVDPMTQAPPLTPGETSATFVVLSTQPPASNFQYAGVLSSNPQTGAPAVFSPSAGKIGEISPSPVPEPTTVLAWAGMAGAVMLARRTRSKARVA